MNDFQGLMMETEESDDGSRKVALVFNNRTTYPSGVRGSWNLGMHFNRVWFPGSDDGTGRFLLYFLVKTSPLPIGDNGNQQPPFPRRNKVE
ncbi:hypothetical protein EVAR_98888_1 [Eumeta japonica]|uniref:Uncharacterized protein n=1 Tax=Eumeta variegata TaxID=151549 RepID=A0A4C2A4G0_EUMVA|nr:hypothetical protein EVAR_98888_1 [Eumeta japonica]